MEKVRLARERERVDRLNMAESVGSKGGRSGMDGTSVVGGRTQSSGRECCERRESKNVPRAKKPFHSQVARPICLTAIRPSTTTR